MRVGIKEMGTSPECVPEAVTSGGFNGKPGAWDFYRTEKEIRKSRRRANDWIVPAVLKHAGAGARVLSVGCGSGVDVAVLREHGYEAWAVDLDADCYCAARPWFVCGDSCTLPFRSEWFDATLSFEVIEHVGVPPGEWCPSAGSRQKRVQFVAELVRVTRPGGVILLATPNRLFPFDEHGSGPSQLRWHLPFRDMTVSYFEMRRLFGAHCSAIGTMSYGEYFELEKIQRLLGAAVTRPLSRLLRFLSSPIMHASPLNPHLFMWFRKHGSVPRANEGG